MLTLFWQKSTLSVAKARVLLTRPAHLQQGATDLLTAAGYECISLPLLSITPIDIDSAEAGFVRSRILDLDLYAKVIFISRNAARIGADLIDQYWPQLPLGVEWIAIGQGTADELSQVGIDALVNQGVDSEALLDAPQLQDLSDQRILLVKGVGGRDLLRQTLESRGANVDEIEIYRRTPCDYTDTELHERMRAPLDAILLTSGEALAAFDQLNLKQRHSLVLIVPSERIAQLARERGYPNIQISSGASDSAMLDALESRYKQS